MSVDASFGWEDSSGKRFATGRRLKWWIVLALLASGVIHVGIWILLGKLEVSSDFSLLRTKHEKTDTFNLERVTINEAALKPEIPSTDEADLKSIVEQDVTPLVKELDEFDLQKNLPEHEVKLTPEVDEMSKFLAGEKAKVRGSTDLAATLAASESMTSEDIQKELAAIKSRILERKPVSENQLLLKHSIDDDSLLDDAAMRKRFDTTIAKKSSGNSDVTEGFSNLDDLLSQTGPLLDSTKPILMPTDLLFQYNQAELQESARFSLMKLGLLIQKNPKAQFIIEGHTDTLGPAEYNLMLSRRRAHSVRAWLVSSLRLNPDQVSIRAFGETRPLVNPTGDQNEQALNRRVEIVIKPLK